MAASKKIKLPSLDSEGRQELDDWLAENAGTIPTVAKDAFTHYKLLLEALAGDKRQMNSILLQLRRALGIIASSEKRKNSGDPIGPSMKPGDSKPKDPKEQARLAAERLAALAAWHKRLAKKALRKMKKIEDKLMAFEDISLTPEELAECEKEDAEFNARLKLGAGADPAFETPKQAFMEGGDVQLDELTRFC